MADKSILHEKRIGCVGAVREPPLQKDEQKNEGRSRKTPSLAIADLVRRLLEKLDRGY